MRTRTSLLLACVVLLAFAGCAKRPVQPRFTTESIDSLLRGEGFVCHVEYRFASIRNTAGHPVLEAIERANVGYFFDLENFSGSAREAADSSMAHFAREYAMPSDVPAGGAPRGEILWEGELSVESEASVVDSLLCYVITRSSYTGGAHGMYATVCHTYSLTDGFELSLADLFEARQLEILNRAIREKIADEHGATSDEELSAMGFFPESIGLTENFLITPEGITFCYNPYEIGCYALGGVEVAFTWEELSERFAGR